jgi:hypothetical protein
MKRLIVLAGFLTLAGAAHAQRGGGAAPNAYPSSGGGSGGGGGLSSGSHSVGPSIPGPYSTPRSNVSATNTGEFVPTMFQSYQEAVSTGQRELDAKQPQLAEAARIAQAAKKAGTGKAVVVAGQDNSGNLVISGTHQNGKTN